MEPSPPIQPKTNSRIAMVWVLTALGIAITALVYVGYTLRAFYRYTESFAPGTEVMGIGFTCGLGYASIASAFLGGACALIGGILSLKHKRWSLAVFAAVMFVAAWLPWFVGIWGFQYIMSLRRLIPHQ
jgi:hypothetical protein